jgi:2-polyprenyl-3-methyl-5-hydroxy-6-metoxy-1,4-benzoquinol methylase
MRRDLHLRAVALTGDAVKMLKSNETGRSADNSVAYHDKIAEGWDARYLKGSFARRAAFIAGEIVPKLPRDGRWLDAGCGSGLFSRMLANDGHDVVGVDASDKMISTAIDNSPAGLAVFERIDTIENLPFENKSFDGAICFSVLEYLKDPSTALCEMARVIKKDGSLVLSIPHSFSLIRFGQKLRSLLPITGGGAAYVGISHFTTTPSSLRHVLTLHGFAGERILKFDPIIPGFLHSVMPPSLLFAIARKI